MIYLLLGGFCMALADSVPGVSGGTVAFVMGFYDQFISSFQQLLQPNSQERRQALRFLIKIGAGWICGMLLAISFLADAFSNHIYQVSSLFLGFTLASFPIILWEERQTLKGQYDCLPLVLLGAALVVILASVQFSALVQQMGFSLWSLLYVFLAGFLAISAMVLPGISGSTLLMTFGLYLPVITSVKEVLQWDFTHLWLVIVLGLGILTGWVISVKSIKKLLEQHRPAAIYAILGMMLGSVYPILLGPTTLQPAQPQMTWDTFYPVFFFGGCFIVWGIYGLKLWQTHRQKAKKGV